MKLPVDHICVQCSTIRKAGREMDPFKGTQGFVPPGAPPANRCGSHYDRGDTACICNGYLVPLRRVTGLSARNNIIVPEDGTPVLVKELHDREMVFGGEALVTIPELPHLIFNLPRKNLTPGFDEVPHKVWTGEAEP